MATLEHQEVTGSLMRMVNDAHYRLSLALFKFHTTASYLDVIPEECFVEVETAMKEVEEALQHGRTVMSVYIKGK